MGFTREPEHSTELLGLTAPIGLIAPIELARFDCDDADDYD